MATDAPDAARASWLPLKAKPATTCVSARGERAPLRWVQWLRRPWSGWVRPRVTRRSEGGAARGGAAREDRVRGASGAPGASSMSAPFFSAVAPSRPTRSSAEPLPAPTERMAHGERGKHVSERRSCRLQRTVALGWHHVLVLDVSRRLCGGPRRPGRPGACDGFCARGESASDCQQSKKAWTEAMPPRVGGPPTADARATRETACVPA